MGVKMSAAERLREQMRKDMLSVMGGEDDSSMRFGVTASEDKAEARKEQEIEESYKGVDWEEMVSGTKKVLNMDVRTVDAVRHLS